MHSSNGCIISTVADHTAINASGGFGQSWSDIKVAVSDMKFSRVP